ncbi:Retrovirus-related Pol polyprotein from type-1 retrotransposable element R1 2 [Lucilia cuprina]|nr:Retrovirus-related Pol polyprotein from type-1 retrotransposable element R1 2 [Lucilia cuprina]
MMSIFRRGCLRICSGYRTISLEACCVIAGIVPLDITAQEFSKIYEAKGQISEAQHRIFRNDERRFSMGKWQRRWENSSAGRWTYKLISKIEEWVNRRHGEVNYHLTQFLSGHGGYRSYLHRLGHDDSPTCPVCPSVDENIEHVIFVCHRIEVERTRLETQLGHRLTPDNTVDIMLTSELHFDRINSFITYVNESLRKEKQLQKQVRAALSQRQ